MKTVRRNDPQPAERVKNPSKTNKRMNVVLEEPQGPELHSRTVQSLWRTSRSWRWSPWGPWERFKNEISGHDSSVSRCVSRCFTDEQRYKISWTKSSCWHHWHLYLTRSLCRVLKSFKRVKNSFIHRLTSNIFFSRAAWSDLKVEAGLSVRLLWPAGVQIFHLQWRQNVWLAEKAFIQ